LPCSNAPSFSDKEGQEGEISFSDYKETDGIKFANAMEMTNPQMGMLSFLTNKV